MAYFQSLTYKEHVRLVQLGREERRAFREGPHDCPVCGDSGLLPRGGPGSYWVEHQCGAYSPIRSTLQEAFLAPVQEWKTVDATLNASMYPRVGE